MLTKRDLKVVDFLAKKYKEVGPFSLSRSQLAEMAGRAWPSQHTIYNFADALDTRGLRLFSFSSSSLYVLSNNDLLRIIPGTLKPSDIEAYTQNVYISDDLDDGEEDEDDKEKW